MAKTIMVSNNLSGTYDYQLAHVKFLKASGNEAAVENGAAVVLGEYFNNESRKATAPTATTATGIYIIGGDVMDKKNYGPKKLSEMENAAGEIVRAYYANPTATFSITADGFDSATAANAAVGKYVTLTANSTKFTVAATAPAPAVASNTITPAGFYGIIRDASRKIEGLTLYKIEVINN